VIPLPGIGMTAIVMNFTRREEQNIARTADEGLIAILDHPLSAHGQVEDIALHPQRSVNVKIEIAVSLNGRQSRHQMRVKRVARQQRIALRFSHIFSPPGSPEGNHLSISSKAA